ncbi:MAG: hypothetical protein IPN01_37365 [Deltaproteobacteria bacterium]|nr:hypothetical protein [Deltaproteobacteria bacterium]
MGVVLWEALSGQRLFKTDSGLLTLERVRDAEVPPLPEGRAPEALEAIVRRALARDPEDRFVDARAMQQALAAFVGDPEPQRERLAALVVEALAAERAEEAARRLALAPPPVAEEDALTTVAAAPVAPAAPSPAPPAVVNAPAPTQTAERRPAKRFWLIPVALITLAVILWPREEPQRVQEMTSPAPAAPTAPVETAPPPVTPPTAPPTPTTPAATPPPDRAPGGATAQPLNTERVSPTSPTLHTPVEVVPAPEPPTPPPAEAPATVAEPAEPSPAAAEAPAELDPNTPALLTVTISQGLAELRIDGVKVKKKPPYTNISVAPGRHLIQVEVLSTGRVTSREVVLKPGEVKELRFDLD